MCCPARAPAGSTAFLGSLQTLVLPPAADQIFLIEKRRARLAFTFSLQPTDCNIHWWDPHPIQNEGGTVAVKIFDPAQVMLCLLSTLRRLSSLAKAESLLSGPVAG